MGKKTDNDNVTVVDLRKKAKPEPGQQGAVSITSSSEQAASSTAAEIPTSVAKPKGNFPALPKLFTKRNVMILAGVIVLAAVITGVVIFHQRNQNKLDCNKKYCQQILVDASTAFAANNISDQKKQVDKITDIFGYDKQPNYMYVVTNYYINISDAVNAQKSYDKLLVVFDQKVGYSPSLTGNVLTTVQLKDSISFLQQRQSYDRLNSGGVKQNE